MGVAKLCYARDLDLRVGYKVVTPEDEREEGENRELGREIRAEAQKLARDHLIKGVAFIGCDVSLDGYYVEVKYEAEGVPNLEAVRDGLDRLYDVQVVFRRFTFYERSSDSGGCDTCGVPLCCATWSGARSMGPVNVRLAKQQGVTPNEKVLGSCGEVKCCMRYEHDAYKEFKERAPFKNSVVKLGEREGQVVDYSMVKDSVLVQFGQKRSDREMVSLTNLTTDNDGIVPANAFDEDDEEERAGESAAPPSSDS